MSNRILIGIVIFITLANGIYLFHVVSTKPLELPEKLETLEISSQQKTIPLDITSNDPATKKRILESKELGFSIEYYCREFCDMPQNPETNGYYYYTVDLDKYSWYGFPNDQVHISVQSFSGDSVDRWNQDVQDALLRDEEVGDPMSFPYETEEIQNILNTYEIGETYEVSPGHSFVIREFRGVKALNPEGSSIFYISLSNDRFLEIVGTVFSQTSSLTREDVLRQLESTIVKVTVSGS